MAKIIHYLRHSSFLRNLSVVMSGTAVAQVITFALTPIISRLFTQADFGVLGSFNSILSIGAALITLQYSQAIMLPKDDKDAASVFGVSIVSVCIITLIMFVLSMIFSEWLLGIMKLPQSRWLLWFLPLSIFINGINQSFQAWCVRRKAFTKTALSQVIRSISAGTDRKSVV